MQDIKTFLNTFIEWAANRPDVLAAALVGSHVHGTAKPDSDVDLLLIMEQMTPYIQDARWTNVFGQIVRFELEDWGMVQSVRVFYADGLEVEFGLTITKWAAINPVDEGTRRVVQDGMKILYDPDQILERLVNTVHGESA